MPLYSQDYDADYPPVARGFKQALADVDAVLSVTPEFNRSIPGGLKNAIDWASRPALGQELFRAQAFGRDRHLPGCHRYRRSAAEPARRSVLLQLSADEPGRGIIQFKPGLITPDGEVTDDDTKKFLQTYMAELHAFIVRVLTVLPRKA